MYCINPDGSPRKVWSNADDVVYALAMHNGSLLAEFHRRLAAD